MTITTTLRRFSADGPFSVGDRYTFAVADSDERFESTIIAVAPIDSEWVEITVEHSPVDPQPGP
jgi:hypothetical protein